MTINIEEWLNLAIEKLQRTFEEKLLFVGLQGSYNRGEATSNSDIDLVVVLDELNFEDLKQYRKLIDEMPHKEMACGFISGKNELQNWSKSDLFQYFIENNIYIKTKNELVEYLLGIDREILNICINRKRLDSIENFELENLYKKLIDWCLENI
ncbi:MAG: nucleotidyltransferase domain-containing protein [Fusobacterium sp.]|nr:nucleotidyltransferase domain-containing protein [Fusobacterium sp.]